MKKLMLCSILSILFFNAYSQDTTCTYFSGKEVYEFDYQMDTILYWEEQTTKFFEIEITNGNILCLDLSDDKKRFRKVITEYFDGEVIEQFLDSQDEVYFTPRGTVKISVGRPTIFKI